MRPFQFPRPAIFMMLLILFTVIFAIEQGRQLAGGYPVDVHFAIDWSGLFALGVVTAFWFFAIAALGYGLLWACRQSGAQRLSNIRTWAERR